jgi:hypothetical protein
MKTEVILSVACSTVAVRESLESVLAPDNAGGPEGMRFSSKRKGTSLEFVVRSESPSSAISTAISLLRDISLYQEVWLLSQAKDA